MTIASEASLVLLRAATVLVASATVASSGAQQTPALDTARAVAALAELSRSCPEAAKIWAHPLCGKFALVDARTRAAVLSAPPSGDASAFAPGDGVWVGRWPDTLGLANTSVLWNKTPWAVVLLPLSDDPASRLALLAHESFHAIQPALGITETDALNPHLDTRDGRIWLRLELAALAQALTTNGAESKRHAKTAAWMRRKRHGLFPGADTLERALEMREGLAEYTGWRVSTAALGLGPLGVVDKVRATLTERSLARSFAYATGPAIGFLLDRFDASWRSHLTQRRDPGAMLRDAVAANGALPSDSALLSLSRPYGYARIEREETARAAARAKLLAEYRDRLVHGPVIEVPEVANRAYDPLQLVPLDEAGTVYPLATFSGPWGRLVVDSLGALLSPDMRRLHVARPASTDGLPIVGRGWTLRLNEGWRLGPGDRPSDLRVERKTP